MSVFLEVTFNWTSVYNEHEYNAAGGNLCCKYGNTSLLLIHLKSPHGDISLSLVPRRESATVDTASTIRWDRWPSLSTACSVSYACIPPAGWDKHIWFRGTRYPPGPIACCSSEPSGVLRCHPGTIKPCDQKWFESRYAHWQVLEVSCLVLGE